MDRCLFEVVVADDSLGVAVAWNLASDVAFEIDVLDARDNRFAQSRLPLFFGSSPAASVVGASARDHDGCWTVFDEPVQVGTAADPIESQLDQFSPFFGKVLVLGHHHFVASSTNADADHGRSFGLPNGNQMGYG